MTYYDDDDDDDDDDDVFYCDSLRVPHCPAARAGPLTTHTTHLQRRTSTRFRSRSPSKPVPLRCGAL
eukprot:SAG11_NODE_5898_length_1437_cov_11.166667_1_plen_66_part_10